MQRIQNKQTNKQRENRNAATLQTKPTITMAKQRIIREKVNANK